MKLNELISIENGIMKIFYDNFTNDYNIIFSEKQPRNLDTLILTMYGMRNVKSNVSHETLNNILISFIDCNVERWKRDLALNLTDFVYVSRETHTKTGTLQIERENLDTAAEKAFNDTEFVNDSKNETNENKTDTYNLTETTIKSDNNVKNIKEIISFIKENSIFAVINEIINFITLKIY